MVAHYRFENDIPFCKQGNMCTQAFAGQIENVLPIKKLVRQMHSNYS